MELEVRLRGRGRVEVAAYGVADAEHLVEKELARHWPDARVRIDEVARAEPGARIVEEFSVAYQLDASLRVDAPSRDEAAAEALRQARARFADTRYRRVQLEVVTGGEG